MRLLIAAAMLLSSSSYALASDCDLRSPLSMLAYVSAKYDAANSDMFDTRARELIIKAANRAKTCSCKDLNKRLHYLALEANDQDAKTLISAVNLHLPKLRQDADVCQTQ